MNSVMLRYLENPRSGATHWVTLSTPDRDEANKRVVCLTVADANRIAALRASRLDLDQMVLELPCSEVWADPATAPESWTEADSEPISE
jgi:hypothetical protein